MNAPTSPSQPPGLPQPIGRQSDVIYLNADRDQVVLGTAGSGKTLMAVYRAVYLADATQAHSGRTLLVTYNKALRSYLEHLVGPDHHQLDVRSYHHVARGYLNGRGLMGWNQIAERQTRDAYMLGAIADVRATFPAGTAFFNRPLQFFLDELDWLSGHGYATKAEYLAAERRGRLAALNQATRKVMWSIREKYIGHRQNNLLSISVICRVIRQPPQRGSANSVKSSIAR